MNKQEVIKILEKKRETALDNSEYYRDKENEKYEKMNRARVDSYTLAIQLVEQIDEPQAEKVEVPDFVAEWLKTNKYSTDIYDLFQAVEYATDSDGFIPENWKWCGEFYDWVSQESDTLYILSDAIRYGYTVKPKRWVVKYESSGTSYYFVKWYQNNGNPFEPNGLKERHHSMVTKFTDKSKAEAVAVLVEGSVEEV